MINLLAAALLAAGLTVAVSLHDRDTRYSLISIGPTHALRVDRRSGQVCHVAIGADGANVMLVGCTTHVTEED